MVDESTRIEAERDYYRGVAERLGRKALTDAQDFTRLIDDLRATEAELRRGREDLERQVAARTADLTRSNSNSPRSLPATTSWCAASPTASTRCACAQTAARPSST
ncbi:MAG: hypothetical protein IPI48_13160 [bacterium]|nr:hypothetical protein [bacterium]